MKKFSSLQTVFYITNVCNYNCENCNSYNNYHFSGSQKWKDYADDYTKWAKIFDVGYWEICGGETMTNPDWLDWVKGVTQLWPNNEGRILTNGSLLDKNKDKLTELYSIMSGAKGKITLRISLHNRDRFEEILAWAKEYLGPSWRPNGLEEFEKNFISTYSSIKADNWPKIHSVEEWYHLDTEIKTECEEQFGLSPETSNEVFLKYWINEHQQAENLDKKYLLLLENLDRVKVSISSEDIFYKLSMQYDPVEKTFNLERSNPDIAHDNCQEKCFKKGLSVPIFFNGKLYKCLHSKLFPDFDKQYNLPITDEERLKINSYVPASLDMSVKKLEAWFENRNSKIFTCTFCPETYVETHKIKAGTKKIFIKKNSKR